MTISDPANVNKLLLLNQLHDAMLMEQGFENDGGQVPEALHKYASAIEAELAELNPPVGKEIEG